MCSGVIGIISSEAIVPPACRDERQSGAGPIAETIFIAERWGLLEVNLRRIGGSSPSCAQRLLFSGETALDGCTVAALAWHEAAPLPDAPVDCTVDSGDKSAAWSQAWMRRRDVSTR